MNQKKLFKTLRYLAVFILSLISSVDAFSQISYTENFNVAATGWTGTITRTTATTACGSASMRRNMYSSVTTGTLISPSVGTVPAGHQVTLTYKYKIADWSANTSGTPNPWGSFNVQYGATATGPWTTFQTINSSNHVVSGTCSTVVVNFTPPTGALFIKWDAFWTAGDYYINFDDVSLTSALLSPCTGTPAPGNTLASSNPLCPGASTNLSLQNATSGTGVTYQWKANGSPILGANSSTYLATPSASTTYTCDVTCAGNTGTSNGLLVNVTAPFSVTTSTPYFEGAEGVTPPAVPACMTLTNANTYATTGTGLAAKSGTKWFQMRWTPSGNKYIYSAPLALTSGNTYEASAWYLTDGISGWGTFKLYYNSSPTTVGATQITNGTPLAQTAANPTNTTYQKLSGSFVAPATGTYYVFIAVESPTTSPNDMSWDDFQVSQLTPCSGTPSVGIINATSNPVCAGVSNTLTVANQAALSSLTGMSFQWDSSTNGGTTWAPKILATGVSLTIPTQTVNTLYRLNATCSFSGLTGTSAPINVTMNTPTNCYCTPIYTIGKTDGDLISNISISGTTLSNNSGTAQVNPAYTFFTGAPNLTATLAPATTYTVNVTIGTWGSQGIAAWIDYNDDGIFSTPSERIGFTPTTIGTGTGGTPIPANHTTSFNISLACTPPAGVHRMRIRDVFAQNGPNIDPCNSQSYGETEDYLITISAAPSCIPAGAMNTSKVGSFVDTITWVKNCANTNNYDFQYGPAGFTLGSGTIISNVSAPDSTYVLTGLTSNTTYDVYYRTNCGGGSTSGWSPKSTFTTLPSCFPPSGLTPGTPTGTTCSVSWTANPLNPTSAYRYFINSTGTAPSVADTGIANATTSVNITGLTPTTQYYIWVKSDCGGGDFSVWSTSTTFTTIPCLPVYTIGKTDGDLISNIAILGTTLSNNSGFAQVNPAYQLFTGAPNLTATLQPSTNYTVNVTIGTWGNEGIAAWIDYNDNGIFEPTEKIGATPTTIGSGTGGTPIPADHTTSFTISLACTPPPGLHRMRVRLVYATNGVSIDPCTSYSYGETEDYNVTIAPANSCPSGGILTASGATTNSVNLNWTVGCATASAWDFEYGPAGYTVGTGTRISAVPATTSYLLTGLLSGTNYDVYMRASCSSTSKSFWSNKVNFKTICEPPTAQVTLSATNNTILKTWTAGRAEPSWDVFVSTSATAPSNTTAGTFENINKPFNVTGLSAGTLYYTWVRAQCHSKDSSVWSVVDTARTLVAAPDSLIFQVNPNTIVFKTSTTTGVPASGRPGCGTTVADDDKFFTCTKPAGITKMYVVVGGSANFDPAFEVMTGGFPAYTSLACVNQNSNTLAATESYLIEGLPSAETYYTIRVYDARTGSGSGTFAIAAYSTKYNVTNIVPCNSVSSSNNTGQVANSTTIRTSFDNGVYGGGINTNLALLPPVGPNLVYYTGTTAFAPYAAGAPLPTCGTTSATPKRVFYSFVAPTVGDVEVEIRTSYNSTSAPTILEAMSATGVPCPTTYNVIKCSTTGVLTLTASDLAPFAGQLVYIQLTQNSASDNAISYFMTMQAKAPAITADSANNNGFRVVFPASTPSNLAKYRVFWRTVGSTGFSFVDVPATASSYKLTNLNSGISYDVWVAYYSNVNSQIFNSEKITFSTVAGCAGPLPAPTAGPNPSSPSCTKALITWPSFPLAGTTFKYRFYYRLTSSAGYSVIALNDTFIYLNNLTLSAGYEFFYKAMCATSGSAVSATSTMYTNCSTPKTGENPLPSGPITINGVTYDNADFRDLVAASEDGVPVDGEWHDVNLQSDNSLTLANNITLYPNPTSDFVTVDYLAVPNVAAKLTLTSIDGKTINTSVMNAENAFLVGNTNRVRLKTRLDLRDHQAGIYVVTVSQEGNTESKQLIVIK